MSAHDDLTEAAELDLLGAICSGASPAHVAAESGLSVGDFGTPRHGIIWEALLATEAAGQDPKNPHVVAGRLAGVVMASGLLELAMRCHDRSGAVAVALEVTGWSRCRAARAGFTRLAASVAGATPANLDERLQPVRALGAETDAAGRSELVDFSIAVREFGQDLLAEKPEVIPTGLPSLTGHLGGFQPGTYVLSAVTKGGKSSLASQMAWAASGAGCPALYFSLEMQRRQVAARIFCQTRRASATRMVQRALTAAENLAAVSFVKEWKARSGAFAIDDSPGHTVETITARTHAWLARSEVKAYRTTKTPGFVVVDYIQLVSASGQRDANKEQQTAHVSVGLHNLAMKLGVPILVLAQLNQQGELRHSAQIGMDADVDMQIVYPDATSDEAYAAERFPSLIIRRARSSAPGKFDLKFTGDILTFSEWRHGI